ncbi:MAG: hypothetical protein WDZ39_00550 [Candidatus Spechtbacterales bacterium]
MSPRRKNKNVNNSGPVIKHHAPKRKKGSFFLLNIGGVISSKIFLIFIALLVLLGGVFYYLFISQAFTIEEVSIEGFDSSVEEEIAASFLQTSQSNKFLFLSQNNTLLFPKERFTKEILSSMPKIKNIEIDATLPGFVLIKGEERKQEGIWCDANKTPQKCFFYDKDGFIYEEAPGSARGSLITVVRDVRFEDYELPFRVLGEDIRHYMDELIGALELVHKKPSYLLIQRQNEVRAGFVEGWEVYFTYSNTSSSEEAEVVAIEQAENLALILSEEIGHRANELEYVDLRLGNKAFYRFREQDSGAGDTIQ